MDLTVLRKPMANINAKEMAVMVNEAAAFSKSYALDLMASGIRSEVKAKDVIKFSKGDGHFVKPMFTKKGNITPDGRSDMIDNIMMIFNLKNRNEAEKVTIGDYFGKFVQLIEREEKLEKEFSVYG